MGYLDLILEALGSHRRFLSIVMEVEVIVEQGRLCVWWSCDWVLKSDSLRSDIGSTTFQL